MNQRDLLNKISDYLATFQLQVKISTANSLYDINIHSETVLIPIFNILYDGNFVNLNQEHKNSDTIDLLDRETGKAFQITATNKLEKIKHTLTGYLNSKYKSEIKELFIYILTEKQNSYSEAPLRKIIGREIEFTASRNVLDAKDLFSQIKGLTDIDKIKGIYNLLRKQFSELYLLDNFTRTDFLKFKKDYAKSCLTNFKRLNFFGLSVSNKPREVGLYQLFVEPRFKVSSVAANKFEQEKNKKEWAKKAESLSVPSWVGEMGYLQLYNNLLYRGMEDPVDYNNFSGLFSFRKHMVILGNPGAGKSSVVKYAICKILEDEKDMFLDKTVFDALPVRIELHKYNKLRVEKGLGFITYLTQLLKDEYHSPIPEEQVIQVLRHFPTLLFFDGMDEIFDIQERLLVVRNDIEGLINTFPEMRAIVTSRFESYTEVRLEAKIFEPLEVMNFDQMQVSDYVDKWYAIEEKKDQIRAEEIQGCLSQLEQVDGELKYNPLLLSLILILYRNALELPTSKLQIYENCTTTIMEHRDAKEKKLDFNLQISNPLALFSALAFWQFKNDENHAAVNYDGVQRFVKQHLVAKGQFEDEAMAGKAANQFLDFAQLRSIYFENKFTHKTFLEFFTANYLYSNYFLKPVNHRLFRDILDEHMGLASWNVVLELLVSQVDDGQIDYDVMDEILEQQLEVNPLSAAPFFLNLARYLKSVSPAKIEMLFRTGIELCINPPQVRGKNPVAVSLLFESIVNLARLPKFKQPLDKSFAALLDPEGLNLADLAIFAYEYGIVSGEDSLIRQIDTFGIGISTDYLEVLRDYKALSDRSSYLKLIATRVCQKNPPYFRQVFHSKFGQKLFFESESFSYPLSFLMTRDIATIEKDYEDLKATGLEFAEIFAAANKKSGMYRFATEEIYTLLENSKNRELVRILKQINLIHFPLEPIQKKASKFYDAFYKKADGRTGRKK